ncbi:MAG: nickel insertion protein [Moorellales bacterium]
MGQANLLLAQVDDASGEVLGRVMDDLIALGARNLQLIPSQTKKGRPGYMLLVDVSPERVPEVAAYLASELGIWGYHLLAGEHRHLEVSFRQVTVSLVQEGHEQVIPCQVKEVRDGGRLVGLKLEHAFLCQLREKLADRGIGWSLRRLRTVLEGRLWEGATALRLRVEGQRLTVTSEMGHVG